MTGFETLIAFDPIKAYSISLSATVYSSVIDAFEVTNLYPVASTYTADKQSLISGNIKLNQKIRLKKNTDIQLSSYYLAPDLIPQGTTNGRFSLDIGIKKTYGKHEFSLNATDLLNTLVIRKTIQGNGFRYISRDYYETQVIRLGYAYKF